MISLKDDELLLDEFFVFQPIIWMGKKAAWKRRTASHQAIIDSPINFNQVFVTLSITYLVVRQRVQIESLL